MKPSEAGVDGVALPEPLPVSVSQFPERNWPVR